MHIQTAVVRDLCEGFYFQVVHESRDEKGEFRVIKVVPNKKKFRIKKVSFE